MAAIYAVYTSPTHPPIPNHLPTLIVTPHGQPSNILYSYLHTNFNSENYLLTPSPQGDLCVAKLFPPRPSVGRASASDPGHSSPASSRVVRCEASRNLKWSIANTGVISPIYKLALPSPDSPDLPLFQISKPNPNAAFWSMFYFAYAGHNIPPRRIEFGKIQKNPPGPNGGGTRISITGKTAEEKAVWQTLGEGNEDCVEWVVLCAALNLLDDEIIKVAEKQPAPPTPAGVLPNGGPGGRSNPVTLRDPGPVPTAGQQLPQTRPGPGPTQQQQLPPPRNQTGPAQSAPGPINRPSPGYGQTRGFAPSQGPPHTQWGQNARPAAMSIQSSIPPMGAPSQNGRPPQAPGQSYVSPHQGLPVQHSRPAPGPSSTQLVQPGAMQPQPGSSMRPQMPPTGPSMQGHQQPTQGLPPQPGPGQAPPQVQPRRF